MRTLTLSNVRLAPNRDAAVRAMYTVVACFPHLEVLTLLLCCLFDDMEVSAADALARDFILAAPTMAPLSPALREVRGHHYSGQFGYTWLRPRV